MLARRALRYSKRVMRRISSARVGTVTRARKFSAKKPSTRHRTYQRVYIYTCVPRACFSLSLLWLFFTRRATACFVVGKVSVNMKCVGEYKIVRGGVMIMRCAGLIAVARRARDVA